MLITNINRLCSLMSAALLGESGHRSVASHTSVLGFRNASHQCLMPLIDVRFFFFFNSALWSIASLTTGSLCFPGRLISTCLEKW